MEAYLDNAATTKVYDSVNDVMVEAMTRHFGNPSSMHQKGVDAEKYITEAKVEISKCIKCQEKEIIFTSGGTEANNLALIGVAMANQRKGKHLITTRFEHPSVLEPMRYLEGQGFEISFLSLDQNGQISIEELKECLRDDTILVSIMYVNNEVGAVQNISEIASVLKLKNATTYFHVDAIQAFGKYRIYPKRLGIDLMSVSAHKFHGPKGIGFLYVNEKVKINPIIFGGGQQKNMRSGTENVPGIAGLSQAVKTIYESHEEKVQKLYDLKAYFVKEVKIVEGAKVNAITEIEVKETAPHIISVSFEGIRSEVLLHSLEDRGVFVSSGSACASNHKKLSGTLQEMGLSAEQAENTIRFSFSTETTFEEIEYAIKVLMDVVPMLNRYRRR